MPTTPPEKRRAERPDRREPVMPDRSRDDTDLGWGDIPDNDNDERLLRERPPHHGDS